MYGLVLSVIIVYLFGKVMDFLISKHGDFDMIQELTREYLNPPELHIVSDCGFVELDSRWQHTDSLQPYS